MYCNTTVVFEIHVTRKVFSRLYNINFSQKHKPCQMKIFLWNLWKRLIAFWIVYCLWLKTPMKQELFKKLYAMCKYTFWEMPNIEMSSNHICWTRNLTKAQKRILHYKKFILLQSGTHDFLHKKYLYRISGAQLCLFSH